MTTKNRLIPEIVTANQIMHISEEWVWLVCLHSHGAVKVSCDFSTFLPQNFATSILRNPNTFADNFNALHTFYIKSLKDLRGPRRSKNVLNFS